MLQHSRIHCQHTAFYTFAGHTGHGMHLVVMVALALVVVVVVVGVLLLLRQPAAQKMTSM